MIDKTILPPQCTDDVVKTLQNSQSHFMQTTKYLLSKELTSPLDKASIDILFKELSGGDLYAFNVDIAESLAHLLSSDVKIQAFKRVVILILRIIHMRLSSHSENLDLLHVQYLEAYNKGHTTQERERYLDFIDRFFMFDRNKPHNVSLENLVALLRGESVNVNIAAPSLVYPLDDQKKHIRILDNHQKENVKTVFDKLTVEGRLGIKSSYKGMKNVYYFKDMNGTEHHRKVLTDVPLIDKYTTLYEYNMTVTQSLRRVEVYSRAFLDKNNNYISDIKNNIDKLQNTEMKEYFTNLFIDTDMNLSSKLKDESLYFAMSEELADHYSDIQVKIITDIFLGQEGWRFLDNTDSNEAPSIVFSNAVDAYFDQIIFDYSHYALVLSD